MPVSYGLDFEDYYINIMANVTLTMSDYSYNFIGDGYLTITHNKMLCRYYAKWHNQNVKITNLDNQFFSIKKDIIFIFNNSYKYNIINKSKISININNLVIVIDINYSRLTTFTINIVKPDTNLTATIDLNNNTSIIIPNINSKFANISGKIADFDLNQSDNYTVTLTKLGEGRYINSNTFWAWFMDNRPLTDLFGSHTHLNYSTLPHLVNPGQVVTTIASDVLTRYNKHDLDSKCNTTKRTSTTTINDKTKVIRINDVVV